MTAEQIRAAMESADPKLLQLADALRKRFNAKLVYLKTPALVLGSRKYRKREGDRS